MKQTAFERVAELNCAFGNAKGNSGNNYLDIDWVKLTNQCRNIRDELNELMEALSYFNVTEVRDALCDIQVFALGAQHMLGVDGDADMEDVLDGVETRCIKDKEDKLATMKLHAAKSVYCVYFEGEYPKMVMKSAIDQPDAPKGKVLKSASYRNTVFREAT